MIWSIIYLVSILIAQYTAEWFIPFPVFGLLAVGTLTFGFTFTSRDYVHRKYDNRKYVYVMIAIAVLASWIMTFTLGVPARIIMASMIAIAIAESLDTEIYHKLKKKNWYLRVLGSNSVSIPTDTALFVMIAFYGVMSGWDLWQIFIVDVVVKYITSLSIMFFRKGVK